MRVQVVAGSDEGGRPRQASITDVGYSCAYKNAQSLFSFGSGDVA
jgi:hypothetical protein